MQATKSIAYIHPLQKPIEASVQVPGSKSYTNRALILATLAKGNSVLHGASDSNDSTVLIRLLKQLGIEIEQTGDTVSIKGNGGEFKKCNVTIDVEDAGTVMRFMSALCCLVSGEMIIKGSERMHQRPIKELVDALTQLGADIKYLGKEGYPPIKIKGGSLTGGNVTVNGSISSQFVSALLMIAPILQNDTLITIDGEQVSEPYIDMTLEVMKRFGVTVMKEGNSYMVKGMQEYKGTGYNIEGDASSASYMYALAALTKSKIAVTNVPVNSLQSDARFPKLLGRIGCLVNNSGYWEVIGAGPLKAIEVNMQEMPDTAQTLAVIAAFAKGETVITGLKTLQIKESKRITALQTELGKMGIECETGNDFIKIKGGSPKPAIIYTYNDHRMAMAFAVAGCKIEGIGIDSHEVVKKSFPKFWTTLGEMEIKVDMK